MNRENFSPEDGRRYGLQGMINIMLEQCDFCTVSENMAGHLSDKNGWNDDTVAKLITLAEYTVAPDFPATGLKIASGLEAMLKK